jgi:hypothetical protein
LARDADLDADQKRRSATAMTPAFNLMPELPAADPLPAHPAQQVTH